MSSVTLVTSFSQQGFISYGHRMLESALLHLPKSIQLHIYIEEDPTMLLQSGLDFSGRRVRVENLLLIPGGVKDFLARHGKDPKKWGKVPGQEKVNFRFAVNRFSYKMFSLFHASENCETDMLVWCDADVVFFADVPESFFDDMLPPLDYLCWLGRGERYHVEAGWVGLRTTHKYHREFMSRYIDMLRTGAFENEHEHHDSYLLWQVAKRMIRERKITVHNLSPTANGPGHPWMVSPLAQFSDHCKGASRKEAGHSLLKDLSVPRPEPYWQNIQGAQ